MVDSNVVRGATSKGRSSSISLSTVLRRFNAICVAAALYFNIPFCPTRLNIADDPTRDRPLRSNAPGFDISKMSRDELFDLFSHHSWRGGQPIGPGFWFRICGVGCLDWAKRNVCRRRWASNAQHFVQMDFDSTLGFPGEGPPRRSLSAIWGALLLWLPRSPLPSFFVLGFGAPSSCGFRPVSIRVRLSLVCLVLLSGRQQTPVLMLSGAMAMPVTPATAVNSDELRYGDIWDAAWGKARPTDKLVRTVRGIWPSSDSGLRMKGST